MTDIYHKVLTVAGSDSGGGAGIQADIKSISACGGYATTAVTATTAQNTLGIVDIHPIPVIHIVKQIEAVLEDMGTDAIKTGMLFSAELIESVHNTLMRFSCKHLVIDPVMVATSGDLLLRKDAIEALKAFLPQATVVTPNLPEAETLLDKPISSLTDMEESVEQLAHRFKTSFLLKAGHAVGEEMTDVLYEYPTRKKHSFTHSKINTQHTHGTGCSLSAALATYLARGFSLVDAVKSSKEYVYNGLYYGKEKVLGKGHGPIHHFFKQVCS